MSLVYITKHDENIYNLNKFDRAGAEEKIALQIIYNKKSRYVSKYHEKVIKKKCDVINIAPFRKIIATKPEIACHKTMGCAKQPLRNPCDFLRKHEGIKWKRKTEHVCSKSLYPLPPIPKIVQIPKKNEKVEKNIIKINIEKNINALIRLPKPKYAITCRGDTRELCNSGIMPAYIFSPNFGRLPKYLLKHNQILCDHKNEVLNNLDNNSDSYLLGANERIQILENLKASWAQMQQAFQTLPVLTDTISRVHRKKKLSEDLHQLEENIVFLSKNPHIYICA